MAELSPARLRMRVVAQIRLSTLRGHRGGLPLPWAMATKTDYLFRYRVSNWRDYNRALVNRGRITLWFDEDAISAWRHTAVSGRRGTPRLYSDTAIECALVIKSVFHLSLRATQGFLSSVVEMMDLELAVPDYSTVSRRQSALVVRLPAGSVHRARHVVVDATGLKVYGPGEWHIRKHGGKCRRTWRKLHLGVDETTKELVAADVTQSNVHDSLMLGPLLDDIAGSITQVSGDGAYDTHASYQAIADRGAVAAVPPRRTARYEPPLDDGPAHTMRMTTVRRVQTQGRYPWRVHSGATRQAIAENAMYRFKALFGGSLSARRFDNQRTESLVKCATLNRMSSLGMPRSVRVFWSQTESRNAQSPPRICATRREEPVPMAA